MLTSHTLDTRVGEHGGTSYRTHVRLSHPLHLAVCDHAESCNVGVRVDHFIIFNSRKSLADFTHYGASCLFYIHITVQQHREYDSFLYKWLNILELFTLLTFKSSCVRLYLISSSLGIYYVSA